jgi:glycosyltransferase involved in cell wall biosynthesis
MKEFKSRKKITFLGVGVYTIPSYRALLNKLAESYDITVCFEFPREVKYKVNFFVRTIPSCMSRFKWIREFYFALMIFKELLFKRAHILHAHSIYPSGFFAILFGKIFRIRVVVSLDAAEASALPEINFGELLSNRRKRLNKWVIEQADEVIVLTKFVLSEVRNNLKTDRPCHIIPRGVDMNKFQYRPRPIGAPLKIINVSYLNPVKDQETLLKAFAAITESIDSVLMHVGEDLSHGEVQQMVQELGLKNKVKFIGSVPNDDLPQYYHQADILLHTSRYESQAIVVNEAMACGLLVCGTHVGIMADLANTCCLTVKPGDAKALAQTVLKLIEAPVQIERLRQNAYQWSLQHSLEWTAERHEAIYQNLLQKR